MREWIASLSPLERVLWVLAGLLAMAALAVFIPSLLPDSRSVARSAALTRLAPGNLPTRSPSPSPSLSRTPTASSTPLPTLEPLIIPTPPADGVSLTFAPNPDRTGWLGSQELAPHWRDRNLHSGTYQGQSLVALLQFNLADLAPGSKILYAALELTGRSARLAPTGEWKVETIDVKSDVGWDDLTYDALQQAPRLAMLGKPYAPEELAAGQTNRFVFAPDQLKLVEKQLDAGTLDLRVSGPTGANDNLFTWDAGPGVTAPTLYVVAVPASFVVITATPTPVNVFAAATLVTQQTRQAEQFGTPTPLPRSIVTASPVVPTIRIITNTPTPGHVATEIFRSAYATAVAVTTGTPTPLPPNWITATPLPLMIPIENLTPVPTPAPTPTPRNLIQLASQPLPPQFFNKILFQSGSRDAPLIWAIDPDGKNLALVTDRAIYDRATARDVISPDGAFLLYNAPHIDFPDALQIWIQVQGPPPLFRTLYWQRLTTIRRGYAYAPAWAPYGNKFAYASTETGRDEIWVMELDPRKTQRLTNSIDWYWNQYPSWSPDGKRIAFSSDRGHMGSFTEVWTMNADGTGDEIKLGDGTRDAWAPVWVKWKQ